MKKYIVKQQDESDCGSCAIASIIKYHDGYIPLEVIKTDTFTTSAGTNFFYMKKASEKYGFQCFGKKIESFDKVKLPCIAQTNINGYKHFVVVYNTHDKITYMDPAYGKVTSNKNDFFKIFTGNILELIPASKIIKYKKNNKFINIIKKIYKENVFSILMLIILLSIFIALSLISSFNLLLIRNKKLVVLIFLLIIIKSIVNYAKNTMVSHLNKKINTSLLKDYTEYIFNLPLKYLQIKKPGDLINRISDLNNIKDFFSKTLVEFFVNVILALGSLSLLFFINPKLTLILMFLIVVYVVVLSFANKGLYHKVINVIENDNDFMDVVVEYLNKIKTIKILKSNYFQNNINNNINKNLDSKFKLDKKLYKVEFIRDFLEDLMLLLILYIYYKSNSDYAMLIIYISVYNYFINSISFFINLIPTLLYFKEVFIRVKSIYDLDITERVIKQSNNGEIIIKKLSFSYNNFNTVLDNINLYIKSKDKVLLKGGNGSGKSTLLGVITGVYKDYVGEVKTSSNISYIEQNSEVFSDTIINNIVLDQLYDPEKFKVVERMVLLKDVIKNKESGYNTLISSLANLSGGEKQKIILARTLYVNFDILIMDESLSEISKILRKEILINILNYYKNKTIIYVSHNDEDINFDQKIYLNNRKECYVNK